MLRAEEPKVLGFVSEAVGSLTVSFLSPTAVESPVSSVVPGVLGVLAVDPKDAKAPDPSPKAEDAPLVGEATLVVVKGEMLLKGFLPLFAVSPPKRLIAENGRGSCLEVSLSPFVFEVDKESLPEL